MKSGLIRHDWREGANRFKGDWRFCEAKAQIVSREIGAKAQIVQFGRFAFEAAMTRMFNTLTSPPQTQSHRLNPDLTSPAEEKERAWYGDWRFCEAKAQIVQFGRFAFEAAMTRMFNTLTSSPQTQSHRLKPDLTSPA